jgi:hypothetical protein
MAEWWLLRALAYAANLRILGRRQLIFNLPAGVPKRRFFSSYGVVFLGRSVPSGVVPGDGDGGHDSKLRREIDGGGPDCSFSFYFRVLSAEVRGLGCIFNFSRDPLCNMYPTALN